MAGPACILSALPRGSEIREAFNERMGRQWTGVTVDGRNYVRTRRMIEWLRDINSSWATTTTNGGLLLEYVYEPLYEFRPIEWDQISNDDYIVMFGFLTHMGYGQLIDVFRQYSIRDIDLRKPNTILRESMLKEKFGSLSDMQTFIENFERQRWEFSPIEFKLGIDLNFNDEQVILPLCRRQQINSKGATAALWEVVVEEDFVDENLRKAIECTKYDDRNFGTCYRFAIKSYGRKWEDNYNSERNAFHGLRDEENMIKYLGTVKRAQSYDILLEFGEDDLNQYFVVHSPPALGQEIIDFWENLLQVVDALQRVHSLEQKRKDGSIHWYMGCHADVKPDNILRVQGSFKLADFGFATFVPCGVGNLTPVGGTETYGAPEFFERNEMLCSDEEPRTVTNLIDTWSIGCVLSVAVTWVTQGYQGIKQFQTYRQTAIEKLKQRPEVADLHNLCEDAFHDGSNVLEEVTNWHHFLRGVMRKSDPISSEILDLIEEEALVQCEHRSDSATLYQKLKGLVDTAKKNLDEQIAESVIESIVSFDKTAPSTMKEYSDQRRKETERLIQSQDGDSKHSNKSARLTDIIPARVGHRQVLGRPSPNSPINLNLHFENVPIYDSLAYTREFNSASGSQGRTSRSLPLLITSTQDIAMSCPIWHEYSTFNENKKRLSFSNWRGPKKDQYLSSFIDDRDFIFIIDDGTSMKRHWRPTTATLQVLANRVVASDDDGVDLVFTFAKDLNLSNVKKPWGRFGKAMKLAGERISTDPLKPLATDMAKILGEVFQRYENSQSRHRTTLIILTDGVWEGCAGTNEIEEKIARFFQSSRRTKGFEDRKFTIQFVSFGKEAITRLDSLDNDMAKTYSIPDSIDHEPWTGEINKMILGSLSAQHDKAETGSPVNRQDVLSFGALASPIMRTNQPPRSTGGNF
ncbi:hypothetical protein NPX13_g2029 [Xylaria arbuscula]|uniref:Protein kinase domain-containing protein n=1 Tax=Xylaria arbuscula TaxID=114810 RepID=A0A9W8NJZ1_9PEZI|nr:hypothetical protein NPX13_g2029 [Xylaria arbuscula]